MIHFGQANAPLSESDNAAPTSLQPCRLVDIPQHVIQRGNNRQPVFFTDNDYLLYLEYLKAAAKKHQCDIHAYVLMTNHVHLLITPHKPDGIAKTMQSLGRRYVYHINRCYRRTGTLWEGRYKASLVDSAQYLLACYRYIELNPVRAGMVNTPQEYRWSSYRAHAQGVPDDLITDHMEYLALGRTLVERQQAYQALFVRYIDAQMLQAIRDYLNQCRVLGSERFKDEIEQQLKRRVRPGKAGRPKKQLADDEQEEMAV